MTSLRPLAVDAHWPLGGLATFSAETLSRLGDHWNITPVRGPDNLSPSSPLKPAALSAFGLKERSLPFFTPGYMPPAVWKGPVACTIHDLLYLDPSLIDDRAKRIFYRTVIAPLVRRCELVFTVSTESADLIEQMLGVDNERIRIIGDGVAELFFRAGESNTPDHRQPGTERPARVVYVGNWLQHKRMSLFVESLAETDPSLDFSVSLPPDPPTDIQSLVAELRPTIKVEFREGYLNQEGVARLIAESDVLMLLSRAEGFGLTPLEAQAAQTAVLVSNFDGARTRYDAGATYVHAEPSAGDVGAALSALVRDKRLRDESIANGLTNAATYTWASVASRINAGLNELGA